jgi:DNA-binding NtrC family response regulator
MIDDEERWVKGYREALELEGYKVELISRVDDLDNCLVAGNKEKYQLIILDIMMASGKKYKDEDVDEGMKTGNFVLLDIQSVWPDIPVIILTNKRDQSIAKLVSKNCIGTYMKDATDSIKLVAVVNEILGGKKDGIG